MIYVIPLTTALTYKVYKIKFIYNSTRFAEWHIVNSLAPGICGNNFERIIFKLIIHVP